MCAYSQIYPRLVATADTVYSGVPQGLDQYNYLIYARAVWRSPTFITYQYPFDLFWPTPPVIFHIPIVLAAWIGWFTGLPAAFEILRIAGAAGSGAAIAVLMKKIVPSARLGKWFLIALLAGGGWFSWRAVRIGYPQCGFAVLADWWNWVPGAAGPIYTWLPYLLHNLLAPLEMVYHAMVLSAFAAVLCQRHGLALILCAVTWFSNPFPAIVLSATLLPWYLIEAGLTWRTGNRSVGKWMISILLVSGIGAAYYGLILPQWPVLKEVTDVHITSLAPALSAWQLLLLTGPWGFIAAWSVLSRQGRRTIWKRSSARLFGVLTLSQIALLYHDRIPGIKALQPLHFNRGYLQTGLVAIGFICFRQCVAAKVRWAVPLMVVSVFSTNPDQFLYVIRLAQEGITEGYVDRDLYRIKEQLNEDRTPGIFLFEPPLGAAYLAAFSDHLPYDLPESIFLPLTEERKERLARALNGEQGGVRGLGITHAVLWSNSMTLTQLQSQGWEPVFTSSRYVHLKAPPK